MSASPAEPQSNTNALLAIAPGGLRERRASSHVLPSERSIIGVTGISAVPENAVLDIEDVDPIDGDKKSSSFAPTIPALSQLPSLYIDKQSANISGYAPGALTPGYSASNTPATAREAYFEDSYGPSAPILETSTKPARLKRRLAVSFFGFFCAGWSDGSEFYVP